MGNSWYIKDLLGFRVGKTWQDEVPRYDREENEDLTKTNASIEDSRTYPTQAKLST